MSNYHYNNMFTTPKSLADVINYVLASPPDSRSIALIAIGMLNNYYSLLLKEKDLRISELEGDSK